MISVVCVSLQNSDSFSAQYFTWLGVHAGDSL
jgi:hypothetical protein